MLLWNTSTALYVLKCTLQWGSNTMLLGSHLTMSLLLHKAWPQPCALLSACLPCASLSKSWAYVLTWKSTAWYLGAVEGELTLVPSGGLYALSLCGCTEQKLFSAFIQDESSVFVVDHMLMGQREGWAGSSRSKDPLWASGCLSPGLA